MGVQRDDRYSRHRQVEQECVYRPTPVQSAAQECGTEQECRDDIEARAGISNDARDHSSEREPERHERPPD